VCYQQSISVWGASAVKPLVITASNPIYIHSTSPIRRYAGSLSFEGRDETLIFFSFSDALANRQISSAIIYTLLDATLHLKAHMEHVINIINRRHRMAQVADWVSVKLQVGLALKVATGEKGIVQEEALIIKSAASHLYFLLYLYDQSPQKARS
jgi:exosome complex exonuclease DIS3/RRP44